MDLEKQTDAPKATGDALRQSLRIEAMARRAAIPADERAYRSYDLCQELLASLDMTLALQGAEGLADEAAQDGDPVPVVCVYSAFPEEVDLASFIEGARTRGVDVAFPVMMEDARSVNDTAQTMEMRIVPAGEKSAYGCGAGGDGACGFSAASASVPAFLEKPLKRYRHDDADLVAFPYADPRSVAMLVAPLVAFDGEGNRLGYGGGNYDRYLTQLPESTRLVGVAFAEQEVDCVPVEDHDIPMTILVG